MKLEIDLDGIWRFEILKYQHLLDVAPWKYDKPLEKGDESLACSHNVRVETYGKANISEAGKAPRIRNSD